MTVLSWILVETTVIYAGVNSLRYDSDLDARELILRQTQMGAVPRGRGSLREISPHYRDGREIGDGPPHSRPNRHRLGPPAVRHLDTRLSLRPRVWCVRRGRSSAHQLLRPDAQTELRR
jgi:hypothetical protein